MMRQAVIFDMDGLMVDSEPLARRAWAEVLAAYGQVLTDDVYHRMIGRRTVESAQILLDAYPLPTYTAASLAAHKTAVFAGIRAQGVPMMPGLLELVTAVTQRQIPWAVATSSVREHAEIILGQLGLTAACGAIAAGDEVTHGKPAPDIYRLAAQRLGIEPARCLALEDSQPGCYAAVAAGMKTIAIPSADTRMADFSFVYAIYPSLHDVAAHLDALLRD